MKMYRNEERFGRSVFGTRFFLCPGFVTRVDKTKESSTKLASPDKVVSIDCVNFYRIHIKMCIRQPRPVKEYLT